MPRWGNNTIYDLLLEKNTKEKPQKTAHHKVEFVFEREKFMFFKKQIPLYDLVCFVVFVGFFSHSKS